MAVEVVEAIVKVNWVEEKAFDVSFDRLVMNRRVHLLGSGIDFASIHFGSRDLFACEGSAKREQ